MLLASYLLREPRARQHGLSLAGEDVLEPEQMKCKCCYSLLPLLPPLPAAVPKFGQKNWAASLFLQENPSIHQPGRDRFWPFPSFHSWSPLLLVSLLLVSKITQNPIFGGTNLRYTFPTGLCLWGQNAKERT